MMTNKYEIRAVTDSKGRTEYQVLVNGERKASAKTYRDAKAYRDNCAFWDEPAATAGALGIYLTSETTKDA